MAQVIIKTENYEFMQSGALIWARPIGGPEWTVPMPGAASKELFEMALQGCPVDPDAVDHVLEGDPQEQDAEA